jgi:hypothetical protein
MGERALSYVQWGLEGTPGTPVPSTRRLAAEVAGVPLDRVWTPVRYADGTRDEASEFRNDTYLVNGSLNFPQGYFQILPGIFQCMLDGTITPAEQTPGEGDYLWAVAPSFSAANAPDTMTLEMGDNVQFFEAEYAQFTRFLLSWQVPSDGSEAPVSIETDFFARQVTPVAVTASQTLHSGLQLINGALARLYLDTAWAGLGGTEKSILRGGQIEIRALNHPKKMGSGVKYFTSVGEGLIGATVTLDIEGNSDADAIYDLYQAGTARALRLDFDGPQIGAGDSYKASFDFHGQFIEVVPLNEDRDGNNLHRAVFAIRKDSSGNRMAINVTTNDDAI